ncbi:WD40-repeat-containing domain protein [Dipodascopsis uninucleata]
MDPTIPANHESLRRQATGSTSEAPRQPSLSVRTPGIRFSEQTLLTPPRSPLSRESPLSSATSSSHRERLLSSRGALSPDRFIPSSSSVQLFHVESPPSGASSVNSSPSGNRSRPSSNSGGNTPTRDPGVAIASALGISGDLSHQSRVLNFQKRQRLMSHALASGDRADESILLTAAAFAGTARATGDCEDDRVKRSHKMLKRVLSYAPFRVLDAPGLRDDFYTNLLSWSATTNDLAVGLGSEVYVWQESTGAVLLPEWSTSPVACVSFAPNGRTLIIGRMDGAISCWTVSSQSAKAEYYHTAGLCCIGWRPTRPGDKYTEFYVGDEAGEILRFCLQESNLSDGNGFDNRAVLELKGRTRGHTQQICGIAFNPSGTQMAVGANDNTCTVWDMTSNGPATAPRYRWDHRAAVKALAYCPWSPSLLATGGGSNDRTIRFWHTNSGSLVNSFTTNAQVTSLIWSRSTKEIAATFGYANPEHPIRMSIYAYPECRALIQIPWQEDIRCLYAVQSPDGGKICAAASDETVRFYDFWDEKSPIRVSHWDNGILGSDILELCEGIEKNPLDVIR